MAFVTIEVVPDEGVSHQIWVKIKIDGQEWGHWQVADEEIGRKQILDGLKELAEKHDNF
jgi:hypothetical protein